MTMIDILTQLRGAINAGETAKIDELLDAATQQASVVPEIGILMDGGLIHEVRRANDAPFVLHIHDEDIEGSTSELSEVRYGSEGSKPAILSTYDQTSDAITDDPFYWESLRNPIEIEPAFEDDED
jgi:hypothetical protein